MQSSMPYLTQKDYELSVYAGKTAEKQEIKEEVKKLLAVFPEVTNDFLIILIDRLTDNKFTKDRVKDAISHVIDTCPYKRPSIADIISFDRKVKTYSYSEMVALCTPYRTTENFEMVEISGVRRWIEKK
jgi:hypothetical protein